MLVNLLVVCFVLIPAALGQEPQQHCANEAFNVTCPVGEVLLVTHAKLGRMRTGRCIEGQGGNMGCAASVLNTFDEKCSGQRSCVVPVHELLLRSPCHKDFSSYLETVSQCVHVPTASSEGCSQNQGVLLHGEDGFIMYSDNTPAISHRPGTYRVPGQVGCPWNIKVKDGQTINLTLMMFGDYRSMASCNSKLQIEDGADKTEVELCSAGVGSHGRHRHIYSSKHSRISAFISQSQRSLGHTQHNYMFHYKAEGCPDMTVPPPAWAVRIDRETLRVSCNNTAESWFLTCTGNQWIGKVENCTKGRTSSGFVTSRTPGLNPGKLGIIFAVLIGIVLGVTIGALLLLLVHCYKRKRKECHNDNFVMVSQDGKEKLYEDSTYKPSVDNKTGQLKDAYPALLRDTEPYDSRLAPGQLAHKQCFSVDNHSMHIKSLPHDRTLYHSLDSKCGDCACPPSGPTPCNVQGSRYIDVE